MTLCCIAYNCTSKKRERGVGFHRFPHNDPKLLKLWIAKLRWKDWTPSPSSLICSKHFESKHLNLTGWRPRLKPGAVPTIFDFPETLAKRARLNPNSKRVKTDPRFLQSLTYGPEKRYVPRKIKHTVVPAQPQPQSQPPQQQWLLLQPGCLQQQQPQAGSTLQLQAGSSQHLQTGSSQQHLQIGYLNQQQPLVGFSQQQQQPQTGSSQQDLQAESSQQHPQEGSSNQQQEQQEPQSQPKPPPIKLQKKKSFKKRKKSVVTKKKKKQEPPAPEPEPAVQITWKILGDASMFRKRTLPSFFHSHYCIPQSFHWPGDAEANFEPTLTEKSEVTTVPHIIKITGRWQWLGLDFRGPLPETINGDQFLLTITDFHSKWIEAFPVASIFSPVSAGILCDVFAQFGYPLGVISRLGTQHIFNLNKLMSKQLKRRKLPCESHLILHHRQAAYLDPVTELRISSMLLELVRNHPDTWNVHLPGCVLRLCCSEHPDIGTSPFARMCPKEPKPVTTPRDLLFSPAIIKDSSFVIELSETSDQNQEQSAAAQMTDTVGFKDVAGEETSNGEGGSNEEQSR